MRRKKKQTNMAGQTAQSPVCYVCPPGMLQPDLPGIEETMVSSDAGNTISSNHEQEGEQHDQVKNVKGFTQMWTGQQHPALDPETTLNLNAAGVLQTLDRHISIGTRISEHDSADIRMPLTTSPRKASDDHHGAGATNATRNNSMEEGQTSGSANIIREELPNNDSSGRANQMVATPAVHSMYCSITPDYQVQTINITVKVWEERNGNGIQNAPSNHSSDECTTDHRIRKVTEAMVGGQVDGCIDNDGKFKHLGSDLMSKIASKDNLMRAIQHVRKGGGRKSPGVDGKTVKQTCDETEGRIDELSQELMEGRYQPSPGRLVLIPKGNGKERGLSIPIVLDRIVARANQQVTEPLLEHEFHPSSHGYRQGRSVFTAAKQNREMIDNGYKWIVGVDIEKFFDSVDHLLLMEKIGKITSDQTFIKLIGGFLRAGTIARGGKLIATDKGLPQGAPLSPLLSNIILHELDWFLTGKGYQFTRYADDVIIFTKTKDAAEEIMNQTSVYLRDEMHLKVNVMKSEITSAIGLSSLGLSFTGDSYGISEEAAAEFQERISALIALVNWADMDLEMLKAVQSIQGWATHFGNAPDKRHLIELMVWARERIQKVLEDTGLPSAGLVVKTIEEWLAQHGQQHG